MKSISLLKRALYGVSFLFSISSQAFSGYFIQKNNGAYFQPADTNPNSPIHYLIQTNDLELRRTLSQLSNGDFISGKGNLREENKVLYPESVDFVGLRRLLGLWVSPDGIMFFKDFHSLTVESFQGQKVTFTYSVTPSDNEDWVVFMSDQKRTVMANLHFNDTLRNASLGSKPNAILQIFEPQTGQILRTLKLERP